MTRGRTRVAAVLLHVVVAVGTWRYFTHLFEAPKARAHRLCSDCGRGTDEIDQLMDDWRHATLTRERALPLFREPFVRLADVELCKDRAVAVLYAAGPAATPDE